MALLIVTAMRILMLALLTLDFQYVNDNFRCSLTQSVPGGKVNIPGGHSIGHCKQKSACIDVSYSARFPREQFYCIVHCTDEKHAMSSHELQSALMLMVEFLKMYYTLKPILNRISRVQNIFFAEARFPFNQGIL
jgi:hypothetical protein